MLGRLLVLAAFALGVVAFVVPFISVDMAAEMGGPAGEPPVSFSVMQIFQGAEELQAAVPDIPMSDAERVELDRMLGELRMVLLVPFVPSVIFLLIALLGLRRFGRAHGVVALVAGVLAVGMWLLLTSVAGSPESPNVAAALGITLLLLGGLIGAAGGVAGIARPQPKPA